VKDTGWQNLIDRRDQTLERTPHFKMHLLSVGANVVTFRDTEKQLYTFEMRARRWADLGHPKEIRVAVAYRAGS
jgi:hypothetical protein